MDLTGTRRTPVAVAISILLGFALASACDGESGEDAGAGGDAGAVADGGQRDAGPGSSDAGSPTDGGGSSDGGGVDAGAVSDPVALLPADGSEVLYSAAVRVLAPAAAARVEVVEPGSGARCDAAGPGFECLLDLSTATPGALSVELIAYDAMDTEVGRGALSLVRRTIDVPCPASMGSLTDCVVARAMAGDSAGFAGVTYLNADNAHARVRTDAMAGIDARVLPEPPTTIPADVELGLMNESTAWTLPGGRCSLPRCIPSSRRARALTAYQDNVLFLCPEHRDVGIRDFYQWHAPFYLLSQGSSSSERDEVTKGLNALGVMTRAARDAARDRGVIGPLLSYLIVRARQDSDVAYLTPDAHPTALDNSMSGERILTLAAAMRADELPPHARLTVTDSTFPMDWGMTQSLDSPFAVGFTPRAASPSAPAGEGSVEVDLSTSVDPNGRPLLFFPAVLASTGGAVTIERLDPAGARYRVRAEHPVDLDRVSGGQTRTLSRVTVGFFPHNGVWLGTPAMLSVGARVSDEAAPNSNNLD